MNRDEILAEWKLTDNCMEHRPLIRFLDYILNKQKQEVCENCQHGILSWVAVDGKDIRESQYPLLIECKGKLREPNWYCADFIKKENNE